MLETVPILMVLGIVLTESPECGESALMPWKETERARQQEQF